MYGSSPKVKYREGMCGAFQWIAELQIPSRDRVSISPRSCVDFVRCAQAEIVCRFRRDRMSISPGDRLGYVAVRLRFGEIFTEVENCRKREEVVEEVDDVISSQRNQHSRRTVDRPGRPSAEAAERSTGPVDRSARTCTADMHGVYRSTARSTD